MIPTPADVALRRWTIAIIVRALALLTALSAVGPILAWLSMGLYDENLDDIGYYAENFAASAFLLIIAAAIARAANWTARRLVPLRPYAVCPACNYRLEGLTEPRCPECGLALSPEFLGLPAAPTSDLSDAAYTLRARETLAMILRLIGLLLILPTVLSTILSIIWFGAALFEGWDPELLSIFAGFALWALCCAGFNVAILVKPRQLARFLAPWPAPP